MIVRTLKSRNKHWLYPIFWMNIFKYCFKNYIKLHEFANCNSAKYDV